MCKHLQLGTIGRWCRPAGCFCHVRATSPSKPRWRGAWIRDAGALIRSLSEVRRCGRSSGVQAPAYSGAHGRQPASRSPSARPHAHATRRRSPASTGQWWLRPGRVSCTQTLSAKPCAHARRCPANTAKPSGLRALGALLLRDLRFDVLDVAVVLCGFALGRFARHGGRVRRDNDRRFRVALGGASVNTVLVVRTIAGERRHRACDLIEQGTGLRAVVHVLGGSAPGPRSARCRRPRPGGVSATTGAPLPGWPLDRR